jgi:hypothetical protein
MLQLLDASNIPMNYKGGGAKHVRNEWGKKLSGERLSQGKHTAHLSAQSRGKEEKSGGLCGVGVFWSLTESGRALMMSLRTVKSEKGKEA